MNFKISLIMMLLPLTSYAPIQDGKVVADSIIIVNRSSRSVNINGYTLERGRKLGLNPYTKTALNWNIAPESVGPDWHKKSLVTSSTDLKRLFSTKNTVVVTLDDRTKKVIDIPLVDMTRTYFPYGSQFNTRLFFGCDMKEKGLEFDIVIENTSIIFGGQRIVAGKNFEQAKQHGYDVIRALEYAANNNPT